MNDQITTPEEPRHFECGCVPHLGPTHCHACGVAVGKPVPYSVLMAHYDATRPDRPVGVTREDMADMDSAAHEYAQAAHEAYWWDGNLPEHQAARTSTAQNAADRARTRYYAACDAYARTLPRQGRPVEEDKT